MNNTVNETQGFDNGGLDYDEVPDTPDKPDDHSFNLSDGTKPPFIVG